MRATRTSSLSIAKAELEVDELQGQHWEVDNNNCMAAILALCDQDEHPRSVTITDRQDEAEHLSAAAVAAVTKLAKTCKIRLQLFNSFYKPHYYTDLEMLNHVLDNSRY